MLISCCTNWLLPIAYCEWSTTMFTLIDSFLCRRSSSHMRSCNLRVIEYEYECGTEAERWRRANMELFSWFLSACPRHTFYRFPLIAFHFSAFFLLYKFNKLNVCNHRKRNVPITLVLGSQLTVRFFLLLK